MYKLRVWKHNKIINTFTSDDLKKVINYYRENWKWLADAGDVFCEVIDER